MRLHATLAGGNGQQHDQAEPRLRAAWPLPPHARTASAAEGTDPQRDDHQAFRRVETEQDCPALFPAFFRVFPLSPRGVLFRPFRLNTFTSIIPEFPSLP